MVRDPLRPEPLLQTVQSLIGDLRRLVGDRVELFSLEMQRAGQALAQIIGLLVGTAIVGVTAWASAWGIVIGLLVGMAGWSVVGALLLVLVINLAAAVWMGLRMRTLARLLGLPATRRHLSFKPQPSTADGPRKEQPEPRPVAIDSARAA